MDYSHVHILISLRHSMLHLLHHKEKYVIAEHGPVQQSTLMCTQPPILFTAPVSACIRGLTRRVYVGSTSQMS